MITDKSIIQIAEQLGIATEHIYEVFVTAQPIVAMLQMVCGIFIIGFILFGYYIDRRYEWDGDTFGIAVIYGLIGFIISFFMYGCMRAILLPEYTAIIKLVNVMTGCGL